MFFTVSEPSVNVFSVKFCGHTHTGQEQSAESFLRKILVLYRNAKVFSPKVFRCTVSNDDQVDNKETSFSIAMLQNYNLLYDFLTS